MKTVMIHKFGITPEARISRSSFDRSHGCKTTFDAGKLVPIYVDEALPGDTFNLKLSAFARMATPIHPLMDNIFMDTHFFAVPIRLVWDNWKKFNGEQKNPGDSIDYIIPVHGSGASGFDVGSLEDYLGMPTGVPNIEMSALYNRAYKLIWNEWFRDENLQDSITVPTDDGPDNAGSSILRPRGKRADYFTTCLPWPQKGDSVTIPLGDKAYVAVDSSLNGQDVNVVRGNLIGDLSKLPADSTNLQVGAAYTGNPDQNTLYADLTDATAATINQLRQAFQVQKLQERDARGGTRYIEIIRSHFGVISPDARQQRPEFLGGGTTYVNMSPIAQTSETSANSPQGNLAAMGTASIDGHGFTKSFTEHCIIIGLVSVRADLTYQQGIDRMFSRSTRYDYYWPSLAQIGEQAVLNKEIYAQGTSQDNDVFGYQERYAEYRYKPSRITGKMRSSATGSLDVWHLSQDFASLPVLNSSFIEENPPMDRVLAVPSEPHFIFDSYIKLKCARPMPLYGVPGLIDHF